jgi:hypothetical protein
MKFGRINLSRTNYTQLDRYIIFTDPPTERLQKIYQKYCQYKKFDSVMPLFESQFCDASADVFGYFDTRDELVAFSIVKRHDQFNAESIQFAWDYNDSKLRMGIRSLEHECAYYKNLSFKYLYLGVANEYKQQLDGFEFLGPL